MTFLPGTGAPLHRLTPGRIRRETLESNYKIVLRASARVRNANGPVNYKIVLRADFRKDGVRRTGRLGAATLRGAYTVGATMRCEAAAAPRYRA
ncbi:hypothetical protein BMS3Bbin02_00867 [bacterium BMS3Bbin02]|nr:hypothetical protein BMS3Bbin02_00867 [bacterium BMS3Bbin02]